MTSIINNSFNNHQMSWEIVHHRLFHPSGSVMKAMCRHQNLTGLPKHFSKKLNQAPCTVCYTENITDLLKGTTVGTNNLQPGELIHIERAFYNVTSVRGFTFIFTVSCEKTRMIWVLPTASKRSPLSVVRFILTILNNEQHPCKYVRVDEYGALANSKYFNNLLIDDFYISMETTVGDELWLNGNN